MSILFKNTRRNAATATICALLTLTGASHANPLTKSEGQSVEHLAQPQVVAFEWLAPKKVTTRKRDVATPVTANRGHMGRGSYICSPSGFGKRSACFVR